MTQIHKVEMLGSGVVKAAPEKPPKVAEVHAHAVKRSAKGCFSFLKNRRVKRLWKFVLSNVRNSPIDVQAHPAYNSAAGFGL